MAHGKNVQRPHWNPIKQLAVCFFVLCQLPGLCQSSDETKPPKAQPGEPAQRIETTGASLNEWIKPPEWLDLQLQLQAQPLGNPSGGSQQSASWMQQLSLDVVAGSGHSKPVELWQEADHWRGHVQLMLFSGDPNYSQSIGAAFPLQNSSDPTGLWLTEASVERQMGGGPLAFKAGVLSIDPGFVSAPVLDAYVHSALNNSLNLNVNGLPINPYIAPGLKLRWRPEPSGRWGEWHYGAFSLDPEFNLARLFGVKPNQPALNGHTQLLQWSYNALPGSQALERPIAHGQELIQRQLPPPLLQIGGGYVDNRSNDTLNSFVTATLTLASPLSVGLDNRLWLGVNAGFNWDTNPVPLFLSGGWLSQGVLPGRPLDVLAFGVGSSRFSPTLSPGQGSETVLELNYSWLVNGNLSLQPVLQLILNPNGSNAEPILATGLQLQLQF